jgi:hypothetical protein
MLFPCSKLVILSVRTVFLMHIHVPCSVEYILNGRHAAAFTSVEMCMINFHLHP